MEHPSLTLLTKRYSQGTPREEGSAIFALTGWSITGFLSKLFTRFHIWPAVLTIASTARHSHAGNYSKSHTQETLRPNKSSQIVLYNTKSYCILEIVFTIAAPAFDILFIGCVLYTKIAYTTAEKLTFEAFYWPSNATRCYLRRWRSSKAT